MAGKGIWAKWVPLKVGLLEHIDAGKMNANMLAVFTYLLLEAKRARDTGIVWSSSAAIAGKIRGLNLKAAQRAIHALIRAGYLKSFATRGVHGIYPLGIERYMRVDTVHDGVQQPRYLNTKATKTWDAPVYAAVTVTVTDTVLHGGTQGVLHGVTPLHSRDPDPDPESSVPVPPAPAESKAPTKALIDHWRSCRKRDGLGPERSAARHASAFADLWGRCDNSAELAAKAITAFFAAKDTFTVGQGHSIGEFQRVMDRFIREANGTAPIATPRGRFAEMDAAKGRILAELTGTSAAPQLEENVLRLEDFDHVSSD